MTTFNITDFTIAGAYCNAIKAANEGHRKYRCNSEIIDTQPPSRTTDGASNSLPNPEKTGTRWSTLVRYVRGRLFDKALFDSAGKYASRPGQEAL